MFNLAAVGLYRGFRLRLCGHPAMQPGNRIALEKSVAAVCKLQSAVRGRKSMSEWNRASHSVMDRGDAILAFRREPEGLGAGGEAPRWASYGAGSADTKAGSPSQRNRATPNAQLGSSLGCREPGEQAASKCSEDNDESRSHKIQEE